MQVNINVLLKKFNSPNNGAPLRVQETTGLGIPVILPSNRAFPP